MAQGREYMVPIVLGLLAVAVAAKGASRGRLRTVAEWTAEEGGRVSLACGFGDAEEGRPCTFTNPDGSVKYRIDENGNTTVDGDSDVSVEGTNSGTFYDKFKGCKLVIKPLRKKEHFGKWTCRWEVSR